jgi:hypothetical protein
MELMESAKHLKIIFTAYPHVQHRLDKTERFMDTF